MGGAPRLILTTCLALFAVACGGLFGPEEQRSIGIISFYGDPVVIEVPSRVRAGEPFEVSIQTYGAGCISQDGTDVDVTGFSVDVTPYDIHSGARICTDELRIFDHRATVTLREPGVAEVAFRGFRQPDGTLIRVVREVVVE